MLLSVEPVGSWSCECYLIAWNFASGSFENPVSRLKLLHLESELDERAAGEFQKASVLEDVSQTSAGFASVPVACCLKLRYNEVVRAPVCCKPTAEVLSPCNVCHLYL